MRTLLILAFLCAATTAAPVPKELKKRDVEGTWKVETLTLYGDAVSLAGVDYWTIEDGGVLRQHQDLSTPLRYSTPLVFRKLSFDAKAKSVDYRYGETTLLGRYELSGDSLKICCSERGVERPKSLEASKTTYVWTFKRVE
jgi:uncharacterized protein (TIGR03067 family)